MKNIILSTLFLLAFQLYAQKVYTDPPAAQIDPDQLVRIYVNFDETDCDKLAGNSGPIFIWTWLPSDPNGTLPDGTPVSGNGQWNSSAEELQCTQDANNPNIWFFEMIPTQFYSKTSREVLESDIHFLFKAKDGGSGGDCSAAGEEFKTEDLVVDLPLPYCAGNDKIYSFPYKVSKDLDYIPTKPNHVFTFFYNHSIETKVSLLDDSDFYVYARAYDKNGNQYRPTSLSQVNNNPNLQMINQGNGTFSWSILPNQFFQIPIGEELDYLQLQIINGSFQNSNDAVDGSFIFKFYAD